MVRELFRATCGIVEAIDAKPLLTLLLLSLFLNHEKQVIDGLDDRLLRCLIEVAFDLITKGSEEYRQLVEVTYQGCAVGC